MDTRSPFEAQTYLKKMYPGFEDSDYQQFKDALSGTHLDSVSPLFFGTDVTEPSLEFDTVLGGLCIRPEVETGISLNELYQALMPLVVAKREHIPSCVLILPDGEEASLNPAKAEAIAKHCDELEEAVQAIARYLGVSVRLLRTSDKELQSQVRKVFDEYFLHISSEDSIFISRMNYKKESGDTHSAQRRQVTEWFMQYHTRAFSHEVLGSARTLIIEDLGQYRLYSAAAKFIPRLDTIRFAAFLPLSDITGTKTAFSAELDTRIIFPVQEAALATRLVTSAPENVLSILCEIGRALSLASITEPFSPCSEETIASVLSFFNTHLK